MGVDAGKWLGLVRDDDATAHLVVDTGVISGATALFGGCATAAALVMAQAVAPQPVIWAASHFGSLARLGTTVDLSLRTISSGRTMTHMEVVGRADGRDAFTARVAAGERPDHSGGGQWVAPPDVPAAEDCGAFEHPVHAGTWADRFDWRLAGRSDDARDPWAAWWVRPLDAGIDPAVLVAVVADYVTYGVGRALDHPMGGLSIDNVLRFHALDAVRPGDWLLLQVRPEGINGGFGQGVARVYASTTLVATGSQSMVMNNWDWRLPSERDETVSPS